MREYLVTGKHTAELEELVFEPITLPEIQVKNWKEYFSNSGKYNGRDAAKYTNEITVIGDNDLDLEKTDYSAGISGAEVKKENPDFIKTEKTAYTVSYINRNSNKYYYVQDENSPIPKTHFFKSNGDLELDVQEYKVHKGLFERGIRIPAIDITKAGKLAIEDAYGLTVRELFENLIMVGTSITEAKQNIDNIVEAMITSTVEVNDAVGEILTNREKEYVMNRRYKKFAERFNIPLETAQERYFMLRILEAIPGATMQDAELFNPIEQSLKQSYNRLKILNSDRNEQNVFFSASSEGKPQIEHIDFNSNALEHLQLPYIQIIDAYIPNREPFSNVHESSSVYHKMCETRAAQELMEKYGSVEKLFDPVINQEFQERYNVYIKNFEKKTKALYLTTINEKLRQKGLETISEEEFDKSLPETRMLNGLRKANYAYRKLLDAQDYQSIYFGLQAVYHHLGNIRTAMVDMYARDEDKEKYEQMNATIVKKYSDAIHKIPQEILVDMQNWTYSNIAHFKEKAKAEGLELCGC